MSNHPSAPAARDGLSDRLCPIQSPFICAAETARTVFLMVLLAAMGPLGAGVVFFGWRALWVTALSVAGCVTLEWMYYRLTRVPSLLGRSHAYLTGVLLALTLPAHVPWYVPLVGAVFAVLVGKAFFGGVGHFLWQPALVGRLAVAVLFAAEIANPVPQLPGYWPVLSQDKVVVGDVLHASFEERYKHWRDTPPAPGMDAFWLETVEDKLASLTRGDQVKYSTLGSAPEEGVAGAKSVAILQLPPINDLLYGGRPGGIGETGAVVIVIAGLYLIYRNYVKWQLPAGFVLAACIVAALGPVQLQGANDTIVGQWGPPGGWLAMHWLAPPGEWTLPPLLREGLDVGFLYVCYQLLSGEFLLAAFFLATEMTSRPVTSGGQMLFGLGAGAAAMLLRLYTDVPVPAYMAVLIMNTFTPTIDALWRPHVFGMRRLGWLHRKLRAVKDE